MTPNELLLKAIAERQEKLAEFNGGILTADRYVRSILECVGSDACYKYAATKTTSFNDILRKSAKTLTYNNPDMLVEDIYGKPDEWRKDFKYEDKDGYEMVLPKNTLMVFKHVLTTPKKDRDGDIMRTQGAKIDPKMPLLWQHVHTLPIGKLLMVADHNTKKLSIVSCIIDMNELSHDAAVMIDNDMGRFSHGFRALEFSKLKEGGGEDSGFDVKLFEIMEESLVSVPSNTDAEVEEIILSLAEGGKLTSPMMKTMGKSIRMKRPKAVTVGTDISKLKIDIDVKVNGQSIGDSHGHGECTGDETCGCGCQGAAGASKEANERTAEETKADDKEVMLCPKCGEKLADGKCTKCGYVVDKSTKPAGVKTGATATTKSPATYVYPGSLEKSYESISWFLRGGLRGYLEGCGLNLKSNDGYFIYTDIIGTYSDHAVISVEAQTGHEYYKALWKDTEDGPALYGALQAVKIETTTTVIEKAKRLGLAIKGMGKLPIPVVVPERTEQIDTVNIKLAGEIFLASSTPEQRKAMRSAIALLDDVEEMQKETQEYLTLMGVN